MAQEMFWDAALVLDNILKGTSKLHEKKLNLQLCYIWAELKKVAIPLLFHDLEILSFPSDNVKLWVSFWEH